METSDSNKWVLYGSTLVIELLTGMFRWLLFIPLVMLALVLVVWFLSRLGIEPLDAARLQMDPQYGIRLLWSIVGVAAIIAYANIIASVVAVLGFGGGSLADALCHGRAGAQHARAGDDPAGI